MALNKIKWKTILALAAVWFAIIMNWSWIWGVVFLIWVIPELRHKRAYFIETVERSVNPVLYWLVILSWILMSLYILLTAFVPRLNPESPEFFAYRSGSEVTAQAVGSYKLNPHKTYVAPLGTKKKEHPIWAKDTVPGQNQDTLVSKEEKQLDYLSFANDTLYFVGISTVTTYTDNQYDKDMQELWEYFYQNDISQVIPDIDDERIFVVYSDYDAEYESYFKVSIAYRTRSIADLYDGMTGIKMPPCNFAVISAEGGGEEDMVKLWEQVYASDLKRKRDFDVEAYTLDKDYAITKTELWVSIDKK